MPLNAYEIPEYSAVLDVPAARGPRTPAGRIGVHHHILPDGAPVVILIEREDNPGPSVTNAAERYWPFVCDELGLVLRETIKLECYPTPPRTVEGLELTTDPTFDLVELRPGPNRLGDQELVAGWSPLGPDLAERLYQGGVILSRYRGTVFMHEGTEYTVALYDGRTYYYRDEEGAYQPIPAGPFGFESVVGSYR